VKVKGRLLGRSLVRLRVVSATAALLLAGYMVLGLSFRSPQTGHDRPSQASAVPTPISLFPTGGSPSAGEIVAKSGRAQVLAAFGRLPMVFEPNRGQSDPSVKFVAHGSGYSLFLNNEGALLALPAHDASRSASKANVFRLQLAGANRSVSPVALDQLRGKSNYLIGNDPAKWRRNIPQFARVSYGNVYPGINLVFYGNQGHLEYDFQVAPGADPARAELEFDTSMKLRLSDGDLIVQSEGANVRLQAPRVYQRVGNADQPVDGRFILRAANHVGFEIGSYDHRRELIIDPVLTYSTYFGGSGSEACPSFVTGVTETPACPAVAVDNVGDMYLVGATTSSANFPVPISAKQIGVNADIFVAKLNPNAQSATQGLEYLTFLGGTTGGDATVGVAVDGGANAYFAGTTSSTDFPTTPLTAYQTHPEAGSTGTSHVFVSVLDSTGSTLKYSSYLSGNGTDVASGVTTDTRGNLYVTGTTTSNDKASVTDAFPAAIPPTAQQPPFQSFPFALTQFFVTKVNTRTAAGVASVAYSTYFGGGTPSNATAIGGGIAVDSTGNIYFTGTTNFIFTGSSSADFPILNAYQPCLDTAPPATIVNPPTCTNTSVTATDAFIAKLNPNVRASQLIWSTYFGGTKDDSGNGIAIDSGATNVYITGTTDSPDIPIPATIAPFQKCLDVPPPNPTTCPAASAPTDAFVARLNNPSSGNTSLTYSSYFGGADNETGNAITVDTASGAFITGSTDSANLPTTANAIQSGNNGGLHDGYLARLNTTTTSTNVGSYGSYFGGTGDDIGTSVALDSSLNTYIAGITTSSSSFPVAGTAVQTTLNGTADAFVAKLGTSANLSICGYISTQKTCPPNIPAPLVSAGSQVTFIYSVTNNGPDLATNIVVTDTVPTGMTFNSATATSGSCSQTAGTNNPAVCSIATLQSGSTATVTVVMTPTVAGAFNGGTVIVSSSNNSNSNNSVTVTGEASDFQVSVGPSNQTVTAGQTAIYTVTVTPQPGFTGSVSLACSAGVPTAASCNFTTNPVTVASTSPVTSTLNLTTGQRPLTTNAAPLRGPIYAIWLGFPGMVFLGVAGIGMQRTTKRKKIVGLLSLSVLCAFLLLQPACSSGSTPATVGGTPPNTYTITLTGTSGVSHNATFTLTVN